MAPTAVTNQPLPAEKESHNVTFAPHNRWTSDPFLSRQYRDLFIGRLRENEKALRNPTLQPTVHVRIWKRPALAIVRTPL
jgi:hypothetical protein